MTSCNFFVQEARQPSKHWHTLGLRLLSKTLILDRKQQVPSLKEKFTLPRSAAIHVPDMLREARTVGLVKPRCRGGK